MASLYVIGPVTGIKNDNREAFEEARDLLVDVNHSTFIPHAFVPSDVPWSEAMRISINHLTNPSPIRSVFFDGVALLPGWEQSEGARLEKAVAEACGIPCKDRGRVVGGGAMSLCETCGYFCGKVGGAILCYWMFLPIKAVPESVGCPAFIEKSKEER